ncbi:hypothetical protein ACVDG5_014975 [Mesorhizobium sp. ORM6]
MELAIQRTDIGMGRIKAAGIETRALDGSGDIEPPKTLPDETVRMLIGETTGLVVGYLK